MTLPAGVLIDQHARVLMRDGRAARLSPAQAIIVAELVARGGRAPIARMAPHLAKPGVHYALNHLPVALDRLALAVVRDGNAVALVDTGAAR